MPQLGSKCRRSSRPRVTRQPRIRRSARNPIPRPSRDSLRPRVKWPQAVVSSRQAPRAIGLRPAGSSPMPSFRPNLATSLNNLSPRLGGPGRGNCGPRGNTRPGHRQVSDSACRTADGAVAQRSSRQLPRPRPRLLRIPHQRPAQPAHPYPPARTTHRPDSHPPASCLTHYPQLPTGPAAASPVRCRAPLLTIFESDRD